MPNTQRAWTKIFLWPVSAALRVRFSVNPQQVAANIFFKIVSVQE